MFDLEVYEDVDRRLCLYYQDSLSGRDRMFVIDESGEAWEVTGAEGEVLVPVNLAQMLRAMVKEMTHA